MFDDIEIRKQFPMLKEGKTMQDKPLVFLDNCATTFKPQCVLDAIGNYYTNTNANAHRGDYDLCFNVDKEVLETRKTVADFVNCDPNEVIFTSGDTESLNLAIFSFGDKFLKKGDEVLLSEAEHASNLLPWFVLSKKIGVVIKYIPLINGRITPEGLKKVITNKTKVVSVAHIGNVLGYIFDVKSMAKIAHDNGAIIIVDGAQSVPHIKTDFKDFDLDFLAFSSHKMCGPTGIGCLIGKYHLLEQMNPIIYGGGMNAKINMDGTFELLPPPARFEAGTLNLAGIFGLKAAINFINSIGIDNIHNHDVELTKYAIKRLKEIDDIIVYNPDTESGVITFNRKGVFSQDEATLLNASGIAVRSGEHCAKILKDYLGTNATVRASVYLYTTKKDIDIFIDTLKQGGDILDAYFSN